MRLRGPGMNRNAIGAAVLGLALARRRNGPRPADPGGAAARVGHRRRVRLPLRRARHDGLRRGRAFAVRRVSTVVPLRVRQLRNVRAVRQSGRYFVGVLPAGARLSIGNGQTLPYLGLGLGFGWTDLDDEVVELSRRFNFRIEGSVGVRISAGETCAWTLEARYQHTSNAGTSFPNLGLNALVFLGGFRFR